MRLQESSKYTGTDNLQAMTLARHYNDFLTREVLRHAGDACQAIDFGAGIGYFSKAVRDAGIAVTCVEVDGDLQHRLREEGFACHASVEQLPPASLEYIFSLNVLEHIENDLAVLRSLLSRLHPGGRLYLFVPAFPILFSSMDRKVGHHRRYRLESMTALLASAGFEVREAYYVDSLGFFATLLYRLIGNPHGDLNPRALGFYDRVLFPLSRGLDRILGKFLGKNVAVLACRPDVQLNVTLPVERAA